MRYRVILERTEQAILEVHAESPEDAMRMGRYCLNDKHITWEQKGDSYAKDVDAIEE